MSFTALKRSDGSSVVVSNTIKDSGGTEHSVLDNLLDTAGSAFTLFGATVPVVAVRRVMFILTNKRFFKL